MENLAILGSLAAKTHQEFRNLYYVLLPVFFTLSLVIAWFRNPVGGPEFLDVIKRTVIATLLLTGFQEITDAILAITNGIAERIGTMQGLDNYLRMVSEKTATYTKSPMTLILAFDDILIASLAFLSYLFLYIARYLMVAVYHFTWILLIILAPMLLLFHLFTPRITLNLFRTLIEVSCWQIVWAVLSSMLGSLAFGDFTKADGGYLTLIIMNFVIGIALFLTPVIVKSLVGGGFSAVASTLGPAAATTMLSLPIRGKAVLAKGREILNGANTKVSSLTTGSLSQNDRQLLQSRPTPTRTASLTRSPQVGTPRAGTDDKEES